MSSRRGERGGVVQLAAQVVDGRAGLLLLHGQVAPVLKAERVDLRCVGGALGVDGDGGGADVGHSRLAVVDAVLEQPGFLGRRQDRLDRLLRDDRRLKVRQGRPRVYRRGRPGAR